MTKYVIRSMSTTDYVAAGYGRPAQMPVPFHIYLSKPEKRARAWWTKHWGDVQQFDTEAEAIEYRDARFPEKREQVVPVDADARGIPAYWERMA